jgi:reticulocyte-binding protein
LRRTSNTLPAANIGQASTTSPTGDANLTLSEKQKTEQDMKDIEKILRDSEQERDWQAHWIEERQQNYERQELENEELTKRSHEAEELRYKNEMEEVHKNLENNKRPQVQKELQAQYDFGRDRANLDNEFERRKESILLAHALADKMHEERIAKTRAEFAERKKLQVERRKQLLLILDQEDEKLKEEEKAANDKLDHSKVLRKSLQTEDLDKLVEEKSEGLRTLKQKEIDLADLQKRTRQ